MNDLCGKSVNVSLAIEMGKGLGFLESPFKIQATFNGKMLESGLVVPEECPVVNTELLWETKKKQLRKIRTTNAPVRVELVTVNEDEKKERIGFVLLSPRCANIVPFGSPFNVPFKWHKLLGVPSEYKNHRPEVCLVLSIRDLPQASPIEPTFFVDFAIEEENKSLSEESIDEENEDVPIKYLADGFIQIGTDLASSEKYLLSITMQVAYNLDLLLPEELVFQQCRDKFRMVFKMFGSNVNSKPFFRDLHANIPMNEKIVVRIASEYENLQKYLSRSCRIAVQFYCGLQKLGKSKLFTKDLLGDVTEEQFFKADCFVISEQKCFFHPTRSEIDLEKSDRRPLLEVILGVHRTEARPTSSEAPRQPSSECLSVLSEEKKEIADLIVEDESPRGCSGDKEDDDKERKEEVPPTIQGGGDRTEPRSIDFPEVNLEKIGRKVQSVQELTTRPETLSESCKSVESVLKNVPPLASVNYEVKEEIAGNWSIYQQYCLDVVLESVAIKKQINSEKLYVKFKHPKASSVAIRSEIENRIGEDLLLENVRCKMFFVSTKDYIRRTVYAYPPKLILVDENEQNLTEELDVYTAMFLSKKRMECSYITEWKALRTYEPLAKISIVMFLQEYGLSALPQPTESDLLPQILDENVTIDELRELQEWKEERKVQFEVDLKILEKRRMARLQEQWLARKKQLEEKLNRSVTRCEDLSQQLQTALNTVRTKNALAQKESAVSAAKSAAQFVDKKRPQLIAIINRVELENGHLKEVIDEQKKEMEQIEKTALTKEQTTNLLQQLRGLEEKFGDAQKAKTYFKDQWKRAVKEIHDLRSEDYKQIQEKLQNQKIELSQLSLESFVGGEQAAYDYAKNSFLTAGTSSAKSFLWGSANFPNCTRSGVTFNCSEDG